MVLGPSTAPDSYVVGGTTVRRFYSMLAGAVLRYYITVRLQLELDSQPPC